MTAVQYLINEFSKYYAIHQLESEIEQAKQMEETDLDHAYDRGHQDGYSEGYEEGARDTNIYNEWNSQ